MDFTRPNFTKFRGAQRNFANMWYTEFHPIRSRNSVRMGSKFVSTLNYIFLSLDQFLLNALLPDSSL